MEVKQKYIISQCPYPAYSTKSCLSPLSPKQAQRTTIWAGFSKHFPDVAIAEEELGLATEVSFINLQKKSRVL